jgi:hypothetical protein
MEQSITLNIPINSASEDWQKVAAVYRTLDGWLGDSDSPHWYGRDGDARYILASAEPSGLLFYGRVESVLWISWVTVLCARLSLALGREVHAADV